MSGSTSFVAEAKKVGSTNNQSGRNENQFKILIKTRMIREEINERPSLLYYTYSFAPDQSDFHLVSAFASTRTSSSCIKDIRTPYQGSA
jgi:hypothetical protein